MTETERAKAKCDSCNEVFEVELKTETLGKTVEKSFFQCPHCQAEYLSFCTDQTIRKKQANLKMLWRNLRFATTNKNYNKLQEKIADLEKEIKRDIKNLKAALKVGDST